MAPADRCPPAEMRWRLGPGLAELTEGDPDAIIAIMRALRPSGGVPARCSPRTRPAGSPRGAIHPWQPGDAVARTAARCTTAQVEPEWVDYNGHMTEAAYLTAAGWASDALFRYIGDDEAYRAGGHSFYTVETHIHYLREVDVHEPLRFTTQVLGVDAKRVHLVHAMLHGDVGDAAERRRADARPRRHDRGPIGADPARRRRRARRHRRRPCGAARPARNRQRHALPPPRRRRTTALIRSTYPWTSSSPTSSR